MKESFEKQWPAANAWLSLKTNSAFKKAFNFQGKNAHSTVLQNAWSQKDQHSHWKTNLATKNHYFSLKNDPGWQKNLEHREKLITAIQNERVLWKAMTCCKNVWLSLKTNSAFKKAFNFQGKNAHSTVLQNAWSQKDQHSHWKTNLTTKNQ